MHIDYDKSYPNKAEMFNAIEENKSDGIYIGRYVLINYKIKPQVSILNNLQIETISSRNEFSSEKVKNAPIGTLFKIKGDQVSFEEVSNNILADGEIIINKIINPSTNGNNWQRFSELDYIEQNKILDQKFYPEDNRYWHNTIWKKIIETEENDGEKISFESYDQITELDLVQDKQRNQIVITNNPEDEAKQPDFIMSNNTNEDLIYVEGGKVKHNDSKLVSQGTFTPSLNTSKTILTLPTFTYDKAGHITNIDSNSTIGFEVSEDRVGIFPYYNGSNQSSQQMIFAMNTTNTGDLSSRLPSGKHIFQIDYYNKQLLFKPYNYTTTINLSGVGKLGHGQNSELHNNINSNDSAYGDNSTAFGISKILNEQITGAKGTCSFVQGEGCNAIGVNTHAEGYETTAQSREAHAEGCFTFARGPQSHAGGYYSYALGEKSFAHGSGQPLKIVDATYYNLSDRFYFICESSAVMQYGIEYLKQAFVLYNNKLYQFPSNSTQVSITTPYVTWYFSSTAMLQDVYTNNILYRNNLSNGINVQIVLPQIALGNQSTAFGANNIAFGHQSTVFGKNNIAYSNESLVCGRNCSNYHYSQDNLFIVGNGASEKSLSNAFRVNALGNAYVNRGLYNKGADYAEFFKWQNVPKEKLQSLFVTLDEDKIRLAHKNDDYILGIISNNPGVVGNNLMDSDREDDPEWAIVGLMGQIEVEDDRTCKPNGYCYPGENGIATASETGYRVMKRIDNNHIMVMFK